MKALKKLVPYLLVVNLVLIPTLWAIVYFGVTPSTLPIPGYTAWYVSFAPADAWLWLLSLAAFVFHLKKHKRAVALRACVGAVMIYILIYVSAYELHNGIFLSSGLQDPTQLLLKVGNLLIGLLLLIESLT